MFVVCHFLILCFSFVNCFVIKHLNFPYIVIVVVQPVSFPNGIIISRLFSFNFASLPMKSIGNGAGMWWWASDSLSMPLPLLFILPEMKQWNKWIHFNINAKKWKGKGKWNFWKLFNTFCIDGHIGREPKQKLSLSSWGKLFSNSGKGIYEQFIDTQTKGQEISISSHPFFIF